MTVAKKLTSGFSAIIAIILSLGAVEIYEGIQVRQDLDRIYRQGVVATEALGRATALLQRIRGRSFYHALSDARTEKQQIERNMADYESALFQEFDTAEDAFRPGDPRHAKLDRLREKYEMFRRYREQEVYPASRQDDSNQLVQRLLEHNGPVFLDMEQTLDSLLTDHVAETRRVYDEASRELRTGNLAIFMGSALAVLLAIAITWYLARSISGRLGALAATAVAVSKGNLEQRALVNGNDEIADAATAFNQMTKTLAHKVEEQHDLATQQTAEREKLAATVAAYGTFVDRVARGDLTTQMTIRGDGEIAALGHNLDAMGEGLRTMTLRTHDAVGALTTASAEILATIQEHSASASESATAVNQTVVTVDGVAQSANQVAEEAKNVAESSRQSATVSSAGQEAVARTIETMSDVNQHMDSIAERILGLSEQAQAVGQIITTVNELAEQSNLLALNASIEAARAGEEGRGFAVVAQEIRVLADQSREATAQVRSILGDIQKSTNEAVLATEQGTNAVKGAVAAVKDAGGRIGQLAGTIAESAQAAEHILTAAQQQVQGVGQISQAMHAISEASAQIVAGTRQIESAARDLNELSGQLRDAVAQYRT